MGLYEEFQNILAWGDIEAKGRVKARRVSADIFEHFNIIRFGDVPGGNYSEFEANGVLAMYGTARVWDDILIPAMILRAGAPAPDIIPVLPAPSNVRGWGFDGGVTTEMLEGGQEMTHDYVQGTDIVPHVHWSPTDNGGGNVKWQLEISWTNDGAVSLAPTTISSVQATGGAAWRHNRADFPALAGAGKLIGSYLDFRLFRDPTDAQDTYGSDAWLRGIGFHYQKDTVGSRQVIIK